MSQSLHLNWFFPSFTDSICLIRFSLSEKLASQTLHSKGFFPLWIDSTWWFKCTFWEKQASQMLHLNGLCPLWTDLICYSNSPFQKKLCHNHYIWMASLLHELNQHGLTCRRLNYISEAKQSFLKFPADWNNRK